MPGFPYIYSSPILRENLRFEKAASLEIGLKVLSLGWNSCFLVVPLFLTISSSHSQEATAFPILVEELDQRAIHDLYNNSEFETVIDVLERFQKNNAHCSFSDSLFLAKHLAVVYSANPATREKGRFYMMRMLELMPTSKLVDMFVSDEIDKTFEKVREEFFANKHGFGLESLTRIPARAATGRQGHTVSDSAMHNHTGWNSPKAWAIGGCAAVAIGTTAYLYFSQKKEPKETPELVVPQGNEKWTAP